MSRSDLCFKRHSAPLTPPASSLCSSSSWKPGGLAPPILISPKVTFRSVSAEVELDHRTSLCDHTPVHFSGVSGRTWGRLSIRGSHAARCRVGARAVGCAVEPGLADFPKGSCPFPIPPAGRESSRLGLLPVFPFCDVIPHASLHLPDDLGG